MGGENWSILKYVKLFGGSYLFGFHERSRLCKKSIQEDVFNQSRIHTVIVCALTTNIKRATEPGNILLDQGEGNLPKQSVLVVSQVDSIDKTKLGEYIGTLSDKRVQQILDGMRFQQKSFLD